MSTEQVRSYYDEVADKYDTKHGVVCPGQAFNLKKYYEPFLEKTVPQQGRVLELGCGTGVYTKWLHMRGLNVTAMDISSGMIEQAKQRCPDATYLQGDCENPGGAIDDAGSEQFDVIMGINTFSYYANKAQALSNYHQLLKPGGKLIFIDMNGSCPFYSMMSALDINEMRQWLKEVGQMKKSNLQTWFSETGYTQEYCEHFTFIPNGLNSISVNILRPFNAILSVLPGISSLAMRIAVSATKR